MVVGARIVINSNRNKGSIQGSSKDTKYLGGILGELKKLTKGFVNSAKLGRAGLGGLSGGIGKIGGKAGAISTIAALIAGGSAGLNELFKSENKDNLDGGSNMSGAMGGVSNALAGILAGHKDYKKVIVDGKERVVEWDEKNKKIVRILSIEEAIHEKILDKSGKLKTRYVDYYTEIDQISSKLKKVRDNTVISANDSDAIKELTKKEVELRNELLEALQQQINNTKKTHHHYKKIISQPVENYIGETEQVSRPDNFNDYLNFYQPGTNKQSIDPNFGNDTLQTYNYWRP